MIKAVSFKTTSYDGYPVRIIVEMTYERVCRITQRFLIPESVLSDWDTFDVMKQLKDKLLIEKSLAFQEQTFEGTIQAWAMLMDRWNEIEKDIAQLNQELEGSKTI